MVTKIRYCKFLWIFIKIYEILNFHFYPCLLVGCLFSLWAVSVVASFIVVSCGVSWDECWMLIVGSRCRLFLVVGCRLSGVECWVSVVGRQVFGVGCHVLAVTHFFHCRCPAVLAYFMQCRLGYPMGKQIQLLQWILLPNGPEDSCCGSCYPLHGPAEMCLEFLFIKN